MVDGCVVLFSFLWFLHDVVTWPDIYKKKDLSIAWVLFIQFDTDIIYVDPVMEIRRSLGRLISSIDIGHRVRIAFKSIIV